jgi:hypothetical protein
MCLNEIYNRVREGKYLCDMFPIKNVLKKRIGFIDISFQLCFRIRHYEGSGKPIWLEIKWYTTPFGLC